MQTEVHRTGADYTGDKRRKRRLGARWITAHASLYNDKPPCQAPHPSSILSRYVEPQDG